MAIPMEHFGKALRLCGVMPSEKLLQTITERIEKQLPVITPPPSDDEEEEEEDEVVYTDEEKEIAAELATGMTVGEILEKRREEKKRRRKSKKPKKSDLDFEKEEAEREKREEEERIAREQAEREEAARLEEERVRKMHEDAEAEEERKHRTKRQLTWPVYRKKEDLTKLAKVKIRFRRFITWDEFSEVLWAYAFQTQYTGQDLLWAFRTLDPKLDYELEPVWPYGADEPLVPTDEIDNFVAAAYVEGKQERFLDKETKRFVKLADFKKEGFFDYKGFVEDYCYEANYDMGVAEKKKKLKLKET